MSLSNSKIMKSWAIEEGNDSFVLNSGGSSSDYVMVTPEEQAVIDIIDQAKLDAQIMMDQAYRKGYEKGQQKGHQEGYAAGLKAGESDGFKKTETAYMQALELMYAAEKYRRELMLEWEQDMRRLAVAIAEKIINAQLNMDEQMVIQLTKAALQALVSPKWINLHVNPRDGEQLIKQKKAISEEIIGDIPLKIIKNPDLPLGSCYLETDKGILDASLEAQILEVKKVLDIA